MGRGLLAAWLRARMGAFMGQPRQAGTSTRSAMSMAAARFALSVGLGPFVASLRPTAKWERQSGYWAPIDGHNQRYLDGPPRRSR